MRPGSPIETMMLSTWGGNVSTQVILPFHEWMPRLWSMVLTQTRIGIAWIALLLYTSKEISCQDDLDWFSPSSLYLPYLVFINIQGPNFAPSEMGWLGRGLPDAGRRAESGKAFPGGILQPPLNVHLNLSTSLAVFTQQSSLWLRLYWLGPLSDPTQRLPRARAAIDRDLSQSSSFLNRSTCSDSLKAGDGTQLLHYAFISWRVPNVRLDALPAKDSRSWRF